MEFIGSLDKIEELKKQKRFDEAWREANRALLELMEVKDDGWYMMYYQMADILAREKKWVSALEKMALCIHYLGRLGGITHEKFVRRLLGKIDGVDKFDSYVRVAIESEPKTVSEKLHTLLT